MHTSSSSAPSATVGQVVPKDGRPAKILARTLYKDMVLAGLAPEQILSIASELISHVTQELKQSNDQGGRGRA